MDSAGTHWHPPGLYVLLFPQFSGAKQLQDAVLTLFPSGVSDLGCHECLHKPCWV